MLIATLAALAVTSIVVVSLLSGSLSTSKVEVAGLERDRQVRASEGALDAAVNQLRNSPTMATTGSCDPVAGTLTIDSVKVRVGCQDQGMFTKTGQNDIPTDDGQIALRLNGDAYDNYPGRRLSGWKTWGSAWQNALGANYDAAGLNDAQLMYIGAAPLRVVGGLEVKKKVAAVRTGTTQRPAVDVFGTAVQGGGALYPAASARSVTTNPPSDPRCGVSEIADNWGVAAADVQSISQYATSSLGFLCGVADAAAMGNGGLPPGAGDPNNQDVQLRKAPRFASADCQAPGNGRSPRPEGGVMYLEGSYDAEATKILNRWFSGECPQTTFYFTGDVWFDVFDPTNADLRKRYSLVFDDRSSNWVFGDPLGWQPGTNRAPNTLFPGACNRASPPALGNGQPDTSGSNITLSSRTGVYHNQGRVVICGPRQTGDAYNKTAITQRPSAPGKAGARFVATGITGAGQWSTVGGGGLWQNLQQSGGSRQGIRATAGIARWYEVWPFFNMCWWSGTCTDGYQRSFTATGFGNNGSATPDPNPADPGAAPIASTDPVYVDVTGDADWSNNNLAFTRLTVSLNGGGSCTQTYGPNTADRMPDNYETVSYNLMDATRGNCSSVINNRSQLRGASVGVTFQMNPFPFQQQFITWICRLFGCNVGPDTISVTVDAIALRAPGWSPSFDGPVTENDRTTFMQPAAPANAATADGQYATLTSSGAATYGGLKYDNLTDNTIQDGYLSTDTLNVATRLRTTGTIPANAYVEFRLATASRLNSAGAYEQTVCTRRYTGAAFQALANDANQTVDLSPSTSVCQRGATVINPVEFGNLVSYTDAAGTRQTAALYVSASLPTNGSTVQVDYAKISATTQAAGYPKPLAPFVVRWNPSLYPDGTGRVGDALFTVFGSTSVPQNLVEVTFGSQGSGNATGFAVFNGASVPSTDCSQATNMSGCRPGLVAGALGGWTTELADPDKALGYDYGGGFLNYTTPWSSKFAPDGSLPLENSPDPVAGTGAVRKPNRRVLMTACVVTDDKGTPDPTDDVMYPRSVANVDVSDVSNNILSYGKTVTVTRWGQVVNENYLQVGSCSRPSDETP